MMSSGSQIIGQLRRGALESDAWGTMDVFNQIGDVLQAGMHANEITLTGRGHAAQ
jgi:hypothetical protein